MATTPTSEPAELLAEPGNSQSGWLTEAAEKELEAAFAVKAGAAPAAPPPPTDTPPQDPAPPKTPAKAGTPPAPPKPPEKFEAGKTKAADWAALSSERDTWKTKAEEYEKKYAGFDPGKLKTLEDELGNAKSILKRVAIERDPDFNSEYNAAVESIKGELLGMVGSDKGALVDKAMNGSKAERDAAVKKLIEGMEVYEQTMFGAALYKNDSLRRERQSKIEQSQANWDKLQAEQQNQIRAARERETAMLNQSFESTLKEWQDPEKGIAFLRHIDGDTKHNAKVDETIAMARRVFSGGMTPGKLSEAALYSALAPVAIEALYATQNELTELRAERDKLAGIQPGAGGGTTEGQPPTAIPGTADYGEAIAAIAAAEGVQFGRR